MKRIAWMSSTMAILALVAAQARAAAPAAPAAGAAAVEQVKPANGDQVKQKKQWKSQTLCPVSGDPINKEVHADYRKWRVYFCCKDCIAKFEAGPDTYMKKMAQDGVRCERLKPVKKDHPAKAKAAGETPKPE